MNKKYTITVVTQDDTYSFEVTASSSQQAYDKIEKEWNARFGKDNLDKQTVGIHG